MTLNENLSTLELGYGHVRTAELDGNTLSPITYQAIDQNGDTIVDGWYYWWDAAVTRMVHSITKIFLQTILGIQCPMPYLSNKFIIFL